MIAGRYSKYFSERSLWEKLKKFSKRAGQKVVYIVLLLYNLMSDPVVPFKTKAVITAALGYFIFPLDAIPDLSPLIGFTDDLSILIYTLSKVSESITPEMKGRARKQLENWVGPVDEKNLSGIENRIQ